MQDNRTLIYPNFPKELIKSQLHLDRYIKFIDSRPRIKKIKFKTNNHHKIPKSLGGSDLDENTIHLVHRAHFIAHLLLAKAFGGFMISSAILISNRDTNANSRKYARLREDFKIFMKLYMKEHPRQWLHNEFEDIYPLKTDAQKFLNTGYKKGRKHFKSSSGLNGIYKGDQLRFVEDNKLEKMLSNGWILGLPQSIKDKIHNAPGPTLDKIALHLGDHIKFFSSDKVDYQLSIGWKRGFSDNLYPFKKIFIYKEDHATMFFSNQVKTLRDHFRNGYKLGTGKPRNRGYKCVSKGTVNTVVPLEKVQEYLDSGWVLKRYQSELQKPTTNGMKWATNGIHNKIMPENEIDEWIKKTGWKRGQTKKKSSKTTKGYKKIYKDDVQKYVHPQELNEWINKGWKRGSKDVSKQNRNSRK